MEELHTIAVYLCIISIQMIFKAMRLNDHNSHFRYRMEESQVLSLRKNSKGDKDRNQKTRISLVYSFL